MLDGSLEALSPEPDVPTWGLAGSTVPRHPWTLQATSSKKPSKAHRLTQKTQREIRTGAECLKDTKRMRNWLKYGQGRCREEKVKLDPHSKQFKNPHIRDKVIELKGRFHK